MPKLEIQPNLLNFIHAPLSDMNLPKTMSVTFASTVSKR